MKNLVLLFAVILITLSASSQNLFFPDFKSVGAIDSKLDSLAHQVAFGPGPKNFIIKSDTIYKEFNISEKLIVFEKSGYRFSVYVQWDKVDNDGALSLMNRHCLTIYYRPIGTKGKKSLKKLVDYHINGTIDEYDNWALGSNFLGVWGQEEYKKILQLILK